MTLRVSRQLSFPSTQGNKAGNELRQFLIDTRGKKVRATFTMHDKGKGKKQDEIGEKNIHTYFQCDQVVRQRMMFYDRALTGLLCLGNPHYLHIDELEKMKCTLALTNIRTLNSKKQHK